MFKAAVVHEAVNGLLNVIPEGAKPVIFRIVFAMLPDVGALVERYLVPH